MPPGPAAALLFGGNAFAADASSAESASRARREAHEEEMAKQGDGVQNAEALTRDTTAGSSSSSASSSSSSNSMQEVRVQQVQSPLPSAFSHPREAATVRVTVTYKYGNCDYEEEVHAVLPVREDSSNEVVTRFENLVAAVRGEGLVRTLEEECVNEEELVYVSCDEED